MRRTAVLVLLGALGLSGCGISTDLATSNKSLVLLELVAIETDAGDPKGEVADNFLLSDVDTDGSAFNDNAIAELVAITKNPNLTSPGDLQNVVMERYSVRFYRSDGRNTEGVDVPYTFQGALGTRLIAGGGSEKVAFILIRHQAKREPPLSQLVGNGGARILTCFAEITFYGRTLKGDVVTTQATVSVSFADFG